MLAEARGPWRRHRELHPAWLVPSGLLSTLDRDQRALPMILRGVRFLVSVVWTGHQIWELVHILSYWLFPHPHLPFSALKQGQDPRGGQKLPRVSTLFLS